MIFLMRHGADDPNRLGGWSDCSLSEEGVRQVHAAKGMLLGKGIECVYASDLRRAKETAEIVAAYLDLPVLYRKEFREVNNGLLAGIPKAEARERFPGIYWSALEWTQAYPEGESPEVFFARIETAWRTWKTEVQDRTVLLVSHCGVINTILCIENGIAYTNREMRYRIEHAGIVCIP